MHDMILRAPFYLLELLDKILEITARGPPYTPVVHYPVSPELLR